VLTKELSVKKAAESLGIKFQTGKAILKTFKKEGRVWKKSDLNYKYQYIIVIIENLKRISLKIKQGKANEPFPKKN
jgi:hypothetical protein